MELPLDWLLHCLYPSLWFCSQVWSLLGGKQRWICWWWHRRKSPQIQLVNCSHPLCLTIFFSPQGINWNKCRSHSTPSLGLPLCMKFLFHQDFSKDCLCCWEPSWESRTDCVGCCWVDSFPRTKRGRMLLELNNLLEWNVPTKRRLWGLHWRINC